YPDEIFIADAFDETIPEDTGGHSEGANIFTIRDHLLNLRVDSALLNQRTTAGLPKEALTGAVSFVMPCAELRYLTGRARHSAARSQERLLENEPCVLMASHAACGVVDRA